MYHETFNMQTKFNHHYAFINVHSMCFYLIEPKIINSEKIQRKKLNFN